MHVRVLNSLEPDCKNALTRTFSYSFIIFDYYFHFSGELCRTKTVEANMQKLEDGKSVDLRMHDINWVTTFGGFTLAGRE